MRGTKSTFSSLFISFLLQKEVFFKQNYIDLIFIYLQRNTSSFTECGTALFTSWSISMPVRVNHISILLKTS